MLYDLSAHPVPVDLVHQAFIQLQDIKFHIRQDIHIAVFSAEIIQGNTVSSFL